MSPTTVAHYTVADPMIDTEPATIRDTKVTVVPVDVSPHFDNVGFSEPGATDRASFNIWSNSFPQERVPWSDPGHVELNGVRFRLAAGRDGVPDNIRCSRQLVDVPPGEYDWIHVLTASERRTEDTVLLHFDGGPVDPEWLRVSDFWPETEPWFGERHGLHFPVLHYPRHVQPAMGPSVWMQRIPVTRQSTLRAVRLPDNPAVHIFAMVLQVAERAA